MIKKKKRTESSAIAWTLARAAHDLECPAREVISNPWLFEEIMNLAIEKPKIEFIMVSGGFGMEFESLKSTEIYSISTNTWVKGPDLPQAYSSHRMALVDVDNHREIFIIGGLVFHDISNSVVSLAIPTTASEMDSTMTKTVKWKVMPNFKMHRIRHGVGVVDGKIFVIGGWSGSEMLKTVEVFSVNEGKWIGSSSFDVDSRDMPTARSDMGVAVIGKKIFVIGGYNFIDGCLSTVEVLDTETNKWSTFPSMKTARAEMGITVVDDRFIWVLGGLKRGSSLDSIEIFDVEKNEWSTPSIKLASPMHGLYGFTVDHKILVMGVSGPFKISEVLDIDGMKWLEDPSLMYNHLHLHPHHNMIGF
jgi:hypothetical protein